jgi:hypothetical protein
MHISGLVARFRADPHTRFTPEELAVLTAAADNEIVAAKAVAMQAARAGDHATVLEMSKRIAEKEPSSRAIMNVAIAHRHHHRYAEARDWVLAHMEAIDPIERAGFLCAMAAYLHDDQDAIRWGNESLELRDAAASFAAPITPVIHAYSPDQPGRNIICFSLWGDAPRYIRGALANMQVIPYLYPGWTPRFYVDASVPGEVIAALMGGGAQLFRVENMPPDRFGMFWRMLVEDDPTVDLFIIRDADSVCNAKERWAVADWLNAGTAFHVMRDHLVHCELMLGGMWGAHRGNIGNMESRFQTFIKAAQGRANRAYDQEFLRREIWPIARQSLTTHDRCFDLAAPRRYDPAFELPSSMHIGQNEMGRRGISQ